MMRPIEVAEVERQLKSTRFKTYVMAWVIFFAVAVGTAVLTEMQNGSPARVAVASTPK